MRSYKPVLLVHLLLEKTRNRLQPKRKEQEMLVQQEKITKTKNVGQQKECVLIRWVKSDALDEVR